MKNLRILVGFFLITLASHPTLSNGDCFECLAIGEVSECVWMQTASSECKIKYVHGIRYCTMSPGTCWWNDNENPIP